MNWIDVKTNDDLKELDRSVCWEDSNTVEYYATGINEEDFPQDINRSGYENKNIHILLDSDSKLGPFIEMVFIDCDHYSSMFLDSIYMSGRVDDLMRTEIYNAKKSMVMRCSRVIYRFLSNEQVSRGQKYFLNKGNAEPSGFRSIG